MVKFREMTVFNALSVAFRVNVKFPSVVGLPVSRIVPLVEGVPASERPEGSELELVKV